MALNRVLEIGRLVADPEMRTIGDDLHVTTIRIAVERDRANRETGEREADFFDVVAWRASADFVCKYFAKGDQIVVDGRLQSRNWTDKDGNKRTSIEIVADRLYFGSAKRGESDRQQEMGQPSQMADVDDDGELPF